jgi:hypothetical protein
LKLLPDACCAHKVAAIDCLPGLVRFGVVVFATGVALPRAVVGGVGLEDRYDGDCFYERLVVML